MPERTSAVWMVHALTGPDGVPGDLVLQVERQRLMFRPHSTEGETMIPLRDLRRVRRVRWSPVLEVRLRDPDGPRVIGFYFVRPPSLSTGGGRFFPERRARRNAAAQLVEANRYKKEEVEEWIRAIREATPRT